MTLDLHLLRVAGYGNRGWGMAVDRHYVIWAYRYFLGRDPENETVVQNWAAGATSIHDLCHGLINSKEFKTRHWQSFAEIEAYRSAHRKNLMLGAVILLAVFAAGCLFGRLALWAP
jgi:hypothetical protein